MNRTADRRLLQREEVAELHQIDDADLQELIDTRQLTEIRIRGKESFDSADVYGLIDSYRRTSSRRTN